MSRYVGKYVSTCDMCLHTKSIRQPLFGELHPLPVLDAPWDIASVDFIVELPDVMVFSSLHSHSVLGNETH